MHEVAFYAKGINAEVNTPVNPIFVIPDDESRDYESRKIGVLVTGLGPGPDSGLPARALERFLLGLDGCGGNTGLGAGRLV